MLAKKKPEGVSESRADWVAGTVIRSQQVIENVGGTFLRKVHIMQFPQKFNPCTRAEVIVAPLRHWLFEDFRCCTWTERSQEVLT